MNAVKRGVGRAFGATFEDYIETLVRCYVDEPWSNDEKFGMVIFRFQHQPLERSRGTATVTVEPNIRLKVTIGREPVTKANGPPAPRREQISNTL